MVIGYQSCRFSPLIKGSEQPIRGSLLKYPSGDVRLPGYGRSAHPESSPGNKERMIEVESVGKRYGDFVALDDVSFRVGRGDGPDDPAKGEAS